MCAAFLGVSRKWKPGSQTQFFSRLTRMQYIMDDINEPILCSPNDPDDAVLLSVVAGKNIDEVFHRKLHDQHRPL